MTKVLISGCNGHMGKVVADICAEDPDIEVVGGFDLLGTSDRPFPVFSSPAQFDGQADALIDFSSPAALEGLLELGKSKKIPLVLATTGYSEEQIAQINDCAQSVPIFRSANFSLGINVLLDLVKKAAAVLGGGYDVEIVERHHNRKVDAPSGTALMIADAAAQAEARGEEILTEYLHTLVDPYGAVSSTLCASRQTAEGLLVTLSAECVEQIGRSVPIYTEPTEEPGG